MNIKEIIFIEEDKKNKGLRKDIEYMTKVFGNDSLPDWLVSAVLKVRRGAAPTLDKTRGVW